MRPLRVLLHTPINSFTGYGMDGIGLIEAMLRRGFDIYLEPECVTAPLPAPVAHLLTKPLEAPFDLRIQHWAPDNLDLPPHVAACSTVNLAWSMWEYTSLANAEEHKTFRERTKHFDGLIGYDYVTQQSFTPESDVPVHVLQGGYDPSYWEPVERDWHGERFAFCMLGVLNERKNPFAVIQAWQELKLEHPEEFAGAELHLKTNSVGLHPLIEQTTSKLRIHRATWSREVVRAFYGQMHCLLAPSRGEGKNVPALEFMSTGGVVAATNWGGHSMWLDPSFAYPLDYTLAQLPLQPDVHWADVDASELKTVMLEIYRNRDKSAAMGARAAKRIPEKCSWDAALDRFIDKLPEWVPDGRGAEVQRLARS